MVPSGTASVAVPDVSLPVASGSICATAVDDVVVCGVLDGVCSVYAFLVPRVGAVVLVPAFV